MELRKMKVNQLVLLGATSLIISTVPVLGQAAQITASQNLSHTNTSNHNVLVAQGQSKALASGKFMAAEQKTTGSARIVTESGHRYLELDGAFSTSSQGPDLHVLLDTIRTRVVS
jgi:Electron transfer DM13